ncbi:hypothetical protein FUAX_08310 [Fulvitalea axinellae]|uniref:Transposase n=1 Tax=Fulvitalea axinellae TaxID=1182444 RepID=A0AAU9C8R9_9BACT|nr:hypothetical protein FUAX_08310 [Fulvitalea axinellae]
MSPFHKKSFSFQERLLFFEAVLELAIAKKENGLK